MKGLTKETFLVALSVYLLESGFNYVRLGSMQSHPLESRFGWYQQLSGSNYLISVKNLLNSERKIRALAHFKIFQIG